MAAGELPGQEPRVSRYEKRWAVFHPVAAIKVKGIAKKCNVLYRHGNVRPELDSFPDGGKDDAFRHVFYMAAFAQKVGTRKLRKLGKAHEKANYRQFLRGSAEYGGRPDSMSTVMDLANNELGFRLGCEFCKLTLLELERTVLYEIASGSALIMKRNSKGEFLDCGGNVISAERYRNNWSVPKCLVRSNYQYSVSTAGE